MLCLTAYLMSQCVIIIHHSSRLLSCAWCSINAKGQHLGKQLLLSCYIICSALNSIIHMHDITYHHFKGEYFCKQLLTSG